MLRKLLPGGGQQQTGTTDSPGLLADWNSYQQQSDVELGTAGNAVIVTRAEDVGSTITSMFRTGYTAVSDGITTIGNTSLETS